MPSSRTRARIGDLTFDRRYNDPIVDVDTGANTVEKQTINDELVVQKLGRQADQIHVEGIITEESIDDFDRLVEQDTVKVRTHRWAGEAIVTAASSDYTHSYDAFIESTEGINEWLYEVRIDLIEVDEVPSNATTEGSVVI